MTALCEEPVEADPIPVVPRTDIDPVTPAPDPAPVAATPAVDWAEYRTTLRGELTAARNAGINITDMIHGLGCASFGAIPDERLPELRELLEAAVKEKA